MNRIFKTLPFRLNAGLILVYLISSLAVFYFFRLGLRSYLNTRLDQYLETEMLSVTSELDLGSMKLGSPELEGIFSRFGHSHGVLGAFMLLWTDQQQIAASTDLRFFEHYTFQPPPLEDVKRVPFLWRTVVIADTPFRVIYYASPGGFILQIAFSTEETRNLDRSIQLLFGVALGAILLTGGVSGFFFSKHALRGLDYVRDRAMNIRRKGDLSHRVRTPTGSLETDDLANTFNAMLERIQDLMVNLTYVMDNIAHDIRTPVTRMRRHA